MKVLNDRESIDDSGTEDERREGEEASPAAGNSTAEENQSPNSREGAGDRETVPAVVKSSKSKGIRKRASGITQQPAADTRLDFLRKNVQVRDTTKLKEQMIKESAGFGGLKSQIVLMMQGLEKKIFDNYEDSEVSRYLFALGMKRDKIPEALERIEIYEELLFVLIHERLKSEKDWRE